MNTSKNRSLKLGLLVSAGALLFVLAVYYLGSKQNLFSSSITVKSYFYNVKGLMEGNKVRYSGINVGIVDGISIVSDSTILVKLSIDKDVKKFIRKDSKVEIGQEGIMGNKIVNIYPGSASAGSVDDDDELKSANSFDFEEILKQAKSIIDDGKAVAKNLLDMSNKINNGNGDLARLINDSAISVSMNKTGDQLLSITKNVKEITQKVNDGEGDFGKLINDTTISHTVTLALTNLDRITARVDTFSQELLIFGKEINHGDGLIHQLVYDSLMARNVDTTITNVNDGVEEIAAAARSVRQSWLLNLFSGKSKRKNSKPE